MTLLSDMRKVANAQAMKKKIEEQQAKANASSTSAKKTTTTAKNDTNTTKKTTTTTKKTTNLTPEQQKQAINAINNIKTQGVVKGTVNTAKQGAENKAQQTFLSGMSEKQKDGYDYLVSQGYSEKESRQAVKSIIPKTVSNWTATEQNDYDYLVSQGYSEKRAKEIIQDIRYDRVKDETRQSNLESGMKERKAERKANKTAQKDIQTDWSTGKKIWTGVKGFGEGLADIGQNTLGRGIDRVAGKTIEGITGQEYTPQWDTSILSEEQQKSRIGNVSQKAGTTAGLTTIGLLGGGIAAYGGGALGAAAGSKAIGGLAGAGFGGLEGMAGAELGALTTDKRHATGKELAFGGALGALGGGLGGYTNAAQRLSAQGQAQYLANQAKSNAEKYTVNETKKLTGKQNKIGEMIQDTSTTGKERAIEEGRITTKKTLGGTKEIQELSQQEKNATKYITENGLYSKNKQRMFTNIQKEINKTAGEMADDMKNVKIGDFDKKSVIDNLKSMKELPEVKGSNTTIKKIDNVISQMKGIDNADDLWKTRQAYDDLFTKGQKAGFGKGGTTEAAYNTWQEGRKILNDAIMDAADNAGKPQVRNGMRKLATLINANGNLKANMTKTIGKIQKNWIGRNREKIGGAYLGYKILDKASDKIVSSNSNKDNDY